MNNPISLWHADLALNSPLQLDSGEQSFLLSKRECLWLVTQKDGEFVVSEGAPLLGFSLETLTEAQQQLLARLKGELGDKQLCASANMAWQFLQWQLNQPLQTSLLPAKLMAVLSLRGEAADLSDSHTAKLKISDENLDSVLAICRHAKQAIRLDANQNWQADDFNQQIAPKLGQIDHLEFIESPLSKAADRASCIKQYQALALPFALDEELVQFDWDLAALAELKQAGLVALVLKPTLLGWHKMRELIEIAKRLSLKWVLSSSFESPLMNSLLQHWLLTEFPDLSVVQGLNTNGYFTVNAKQCEQALKIALAEGEFADENIQLRRIF